MAVMSLTTLFAIFQNTVISHKISRCKNSSVYKSQFCPFQVVFFLLHSKLLLDPSCDVQLGERLPGMSNSSLPGHSKQSSRSGICQTIFQKSSFAHDDYHELPE